MPSLKIEKKTLGDFTVFSLKGELIVSTLIEVKKCIQEELTKKEIYIALNMEWVSQIDSSALGLINNIKKLVDEKNGHFILYSASHHTLESLSETGILGNLVILKDEEEFKDNFVI